MTVLRGHGVATLAPLLDGTRDLELLAADAPGVPVDRIVARLTEAGLLTEHGSCSAAPPDGRAYWDLAGMDGDRAARRIAEGGVAVHGTNEAAAGGLRDALRSAGLGMCDAPAEAELTVVACTDYLDPELAEVDAAQRALGRPWMLVRSGGADPWIGPVFRPGHGACWHCLAHRLSLGRQAEMHLWNTAGEPVRAPDAALAPSRMIALHLAALEAAKWIAGHRYDGQDAIWTLGSLTLAGRHHPVRRRPQCHECGDPGLVAATVRTPVVPRTRPKAEPCEGGDRALSPQQMMDRYGHLVGPVTGVVREVKRDPRGPEFLNCFHAGHNPAFTASGLAGVRAGLRARSSGKGATALDAQVSALCEAIERHSGFFQGDEPMVRAAYREIEGDAVHPDAMQLFHSRQFAGRDRWNAAHGPFHQVCDPFDPDAAIDWTPVWSLTGERHRFVATSLLYYNSPPTGRRYCSANSNGTAAGSSVEDAVVQGFFELVERDAVALWWYNRARRPAADLDALADPWIDRLRQVHAEMGREVWALDLTTDLGIPAYAALSRRTDKPAEDIALGFGAHFSPRTALRRALTELNQMLPPLAGVGDGADYTCDDPAAVGWWRAATVENQPYLLPSPGPAAPVHPFSRRPDLRDDVAAIADLVRRHGMELLILDQTRPDLELPVVKVIVPGLRHFWTRFAPGRLYDVPVSLGWQDTPTSYDELNPIPVFL
ncbi:TOMM precursor leader peptide-binding protein [Microbispora sp. NPDC049125]|uniref:TOMM precursor leader peptide-binding protein n=1 Tax=Microbispora sp. NPDC049125 TaxID=3154929 RepID=UPI0034663175